MVILKHPDFEWAYVIREAPEIRAFMIPVGHNYGMVEEWHVNFTRGTQEWIDLMVSKGYEVIYQ